MEHMVDRGQLLLAITMGGGKTPTTIAGVEELVALGDVERCLVVVPASLKYQWRDEIAKFTDAAKVTIVAGTPKKRKEIWKQALNSRYVIVNPETLLKDQKIIGTFQCMVIDEASLLIKTRTAKRSRLIKKLAKAVPFRYALTGQPIENRPEELFSIMEFVDKDVLGSPEEFDHTFIVRDANGRPKRYRNLDRISKIMSDCMVLRTKADLKGQLPHAIPVPVPIAFDPEGAALYQIIAAELLHEIANAVKMGGFNLWSHYNDPKGKETQGKIMAKLTVLRMLCVSPHLIVQSALNHSDKTTKHGSAYAAELYKRGLLDNVVAAPKITAVVEYIDEFLESDPENKVVLFSFFKGALDILQKRLKHKSVLFTGDLKPEERDKAKKLFQTDPTVRVFLSSDAGGYGVDLPQGNMLISLDLPWSSGKLEQREARIIRASSEFDSVIVATFLMQGSIEERLAEMLQEKKMANTLFVEGKGFDASGEYNIDLGTLTEFLRSSSVVVD